MKSPFKFSTDEQSYAFCMEIIATMQRLFGISQEEAIGRMNRLWKGQSHVGPETVIYHESEDNWANHIYYGGDVDWWNHPNGMKPLPYP